MYWNLSLRIASTSRDGPFDSMPMQPTAIIELTIISPARPAFFMISSGHFCWITRTVGFFIASRASSTSMKERRPE